MKILNRTAKGLMTKDKFKEVNNNEIYEKLREIDTKSIRPLRDGDADRVDALEQEAVALRAQLIV